MIPGDALNEGFSLSALLRAGVALAVWVLGTYYLGDED